MQANTALQVDVMHVTAHVSLFFSYTKQVGVVALLAAKTVSKNVR